MTRDETRGQLALQSIDKFVVPQPTFVGGEATRLYELEEKRSNILRECAQEWSKAVGVSKKDFWTRSLPQAIFDMLHNYEVGTAIVACEAFLTQMGWKIERPEQTVLD